MSWGRLEVVHKVVVLTFNMYAESVRRIQPELMALNKTAAWHYPSGHRAMEYRAFRAPDVEEDLLLMATLDLDESFQLNQYEIDLIWEDTGRVILSRVIPGDIFGEQDHALKNRLIWETALFLETLSPMHVTDAFMANRETYTVTRH